MRKHSSPHDNQSKGLVIADEIIQNSRYANRLLERFLFFSNKNRKAKKMKNSVSSYIVYAVAGFVTFLILLFAALTTFTFGQSVVGAFVLSPIIGTQISSLLSGILTVLLFDAGWLVGLLTFIYTAESLWQRAIAGLQFGACFAFSLIASVVSIVLLSPLSGYVSAETILTARYAGVVIMLLALMLNALAFAVSVLTAPAIAEKIREATRSAEMVAFNARMIAKLDTQTVTLAQSQIEANIPMLAQLRAGDILASYVANMGHSVTKLNVSTAPHPSPTSPTTNTEHITIMQPDNNNSENTDFLDHGGNE